jgi:hypothetical protein
MIRKNVPCLAAMLFCLPAAVQFGSAEMRGAVGWTGFLDESAQNHLLVGGSVRFYLTNRISVEPEFQYLHKDEFDRDYVLLGNVAYDFRDRTSRVVPYVIGGVGRLWHDAGFFRNSQTFASGGFGTKVFLSDGWFVAPEIRTGWEPHLRLSVCIGYAFR